MSGLSVSHQIKSAYLAYAIPLAIAQSSPPVILKKPSEVLSPVKNGLSRSSISLVNNFI